MVIEFFVFLQIGIEFTAKIPLIELFAGLPPFVETKTGQKYQRGTKGYYFNFSDKIEGETKVYNLDFQFFEQLLVL